MINPFTGEITTSDSNEDEYVYGVDAQGNFLGLVLKGTEFLHIDSPPKDPKFKWDFEKGLWKYYETLEELKAQAVLDIDAAAGSARLKYITDVPGQQAVYLIKLQQAEAYLLDNSVVGPYLEKEAEVLNSSLLEAATQVTATANYWNNVVGPSIEGTRRRNKIALDLATTAEEIFTIKVSSIVELAAI